MGKAIGIFTGSRPTPLLCVTYFLKISRMKMAVFCFLALWTFSLSAHVVERAEPPQYQFSESDNQSGLQETDLLALIAILDSEYSLQFQNKTRAWFSTIDWEKPFIGAGSLDDGNDFTVLLWGGLVRAKYMTLGAVAATLCHEIGHKLGGAPHQKFPSQDLHWSSAEGQADHFAATQCLPKVYEKLKQISPEKLKQEQEPAAVSLCHLNSQKQRCEWVATSGIEFIQTLQVYFERDLPFADPFVWAQEKPKETLSTKYPSYQCRMDIFKAGARDPKAQRLRCWFKPL